MYSLIFNPDTQQVLEDYKELLKASEQERLACQVARTQPSLYKRVVIAFGRTLVNLGQRLQERQGILRSPSLTTNE